MKTGRTRLLEQFLADGLTFMFGNPGTVEQGFLDSLREQPGIRYILGLQETIPLAIADAYARAVKRPTLVQLHSGVGLGNGIGLLYQSLRGHAPLVVIAGEAGVRYDAMDAQMACDLVAMARPVTKYATRVTDPGSLLRVVRRAIKIAATPPAGPVFVALPMDVLDSDCPEEVVPTLVPDTRVAPSEAAVLEAARALAGAASPLIVMGDGVAASGAQAELAAVAELLGAEVWGADNSEVNISAAHPLYRGNLGHMFGNHSAPIVGRADAVLIVGTYVFPEVFPQLQGVFAPGCRVVHVDLNAYEIAKNFPVTVGLVADPRSTLAALAGALSREQSGAQRTAATARAARLSAERTDALRREREADAAAWDAVPLHPARFMKELAERVGPDAVVFDEALTSSPELNRYLPPCAPGSFYQTRGGTLGVGVPGAIGLKLAFPGKTVVGFSGDGGSMYTIQALWTAAKYHIGAKFVICNNRSYKLLELNIQQYWRERQIPEHEFPDPFDLSQPPLQFAEIARALHVPAVRVERPEEIGPAIDRMLAADGPFLVDLVLSAEVPGHRAGCACGQ